MLKEYNNRWYVIGEGSSKDFSAILRLAIDRIVSCEINEKETIEFRDDELKNEFFHLVGITKEEDKTPENITFKVAKPRAHYVATKPIHHSQVTEAESVSSITFKLFVYSNMELINILLSFGGDLEVISPIELRETMQKKLEKALNNYS